MDDAVKMICTFVAIFSICFGVLYFAYTHVDNNRELYPTTLIVVEIHDDYAVGETSTGYRYEFDGEDYDIGDYVSCIMDNNNTPDTIEDDYVREHQFGGYTRME